MNKNPYVYFFMMLLTTPSYAYMEETHESMAEFALVRSVVVSDNTFLLTKIGLLNSSIDDPARLLPNNNDDMRTIRNLVRWGARFEDDTETRRFFNHFFDPAQDRPLTIFGATWGEKSPDWTLEGDHDIGGQSYSYKDAMDYLYRALTLTDEDDRKRNFGLMFQTLGHVVHHLQDMAQPQHVRNDAHCDQKIPCAFGGQYDPSYFEIYTNSNGSLPGLMYGNGYPIPRFATTREFWTTTDYKGIADFTNRNFVSKDSNFTLDKTDHIATVEYAFPYSIESTLADITPVNLTDASLMGAAGQTLCNKLKQNNAVIFPAGGCFIDFVSTIVIDANLGTSSVNARASSYSIFNQYINDYHEPIIIDTEDGGSYEARGFFTLNQYNFEATYDFLIPRAVAYSAGLINHFFRGKLQISLPDAGVYGFLDQSTVTGINVDTGFQGFNKIKLKVANITPPLPGGTTPEVMNNGTLEAVMKFHRNTCSEADLSGDTPIKTIKATENGSKYSSAQKEIVVSNSQNISTSNALTTEHRVFTFASPANQSLPMNAIDVNQSWAIHAKLISMGAVKITSINL